MILPPDYKRSLDRWYPLIEHPAQRALVDDGVRFKVVPAGRRSGKTERFKRFVTREAMNLPGPYFAAAPTRDQAKRIFWQDLKLLSGIFWADYRPPSETELIIYLPTGSTISVIGLDQPQRIEGTPWRGGGIDEFGDVKEHAWAENIAPALDTVDPREPDYRAWCWIFGVPEGLNHYYDLAEYARTSGDPNWRLYHWKSAEILPPDVIEAARRHLGPRQFRQEYEASFETAAGRIYEDYAQGNWTSETIAPHEQLLWAHDFNFTPLSSAVCVRRGGGLFVLDEIVLVSAVARQAALEFVDRYKYHQNKSVIVYGDPAGRAGEKHGQGSNYTELEQVLRAAGWQVERRVKAAAPAIRDRQNAVRAKICNAAGERTLFVNPSRAPTAHKGLATVQLKQGSAFLEEESESQHITTAVGYLVDYEWPIRYEAPAPSKIIAPTVNWNSGASARYAPPVQRR